MKKIMKFLSSFFISLFILYIFNVMAVGLDIYIPINIVTVFIVCVLGFSGLVMLILFSLFIF